MNFQEAVCNQSSGMFDECRIDAVVEKPIDPEEVLGDNLTFAGYPVSKLHPYPLRRTTPERRDGPILANPSSPIILPEKPGAAWLSPLLTRQRARLE